MESNKQSIKLRLIKEFYHQSIIASTSYSIVFLVLIFLPMISDEFSFYKIGASIIASINILRVLLTYNKDKTIKEDKLNWQLAFAVVNGFFLSLFFSFLIFNLKFENPNFWICLLLVFIINGASAFSVVVSPKVVFTFLTMLGLGTFLSFVSKPEFLTNQTYWLLSILLLIYYFFLIARAGTHQRSVNSIYQLELELLNQKKLADEALRIASLGELASGLAHEINNPLTVVQVNLKKHLEQISIHPEFAEHTLRIQKVIEASKRIEQVVLSLRSLAIDKNQKNSQLEKIELKELVQGVIESYFERISNKNIKLNFIYADSKHFVFGNKSELNQVVYHLINNAIDSLVEVSNPVIDIGLIHKDDQIIFSIRDNGVGVEDKNKERVFIPFFTTKNSNLNHGIGLSICLNIIKQHHGEIWLEDNEGLAGADFRFSLKEYN